MSRYRLVDAARKVVGVGSVGTGCWVVLLQGVDDDDPLFLQVKEAQPSVLAPYVDLRAVGQATRDSAWCVGQRATQGSPDIFLGWGEADGKHFYVRQLADMKGSSSFAEGNQEGIEHVHRLVRPVRLGAGAGARQVGRSGDDRGLLRHQSQTLDDAIAKFALAYAKQTEQDYDVARQGAPRRPHQGGGGAR